MNGDPLRITFYLDCSACGNSVGVSCVKSIGEIDVGILCFKCAIHFIEQVFVDAGDMDGAVLARKML